MRLRSLRSRLLLGSILWTIGLLLASHVAAVRLVHWYFDGPPRIVMTRHSFLVASVTIVTLSLVAMAAGFFQVRRGLFSLDRLRQRLAALRSGSTARLDGPFPAEVEPLVDDLNALLDHREEVVRRALAKAGDLAHGLKTPLAVLAHEAERAEAAGQTELAATLGGQVARMRRQVEIHLAQARAAGAGARLGARAPVAAAAEALVRTLERLHAERKLAFATSIAPSLAVRAEPEDLEEMLGNLIDNAAKWARSSVQITASLAADSVEILVDDDGGGIPPERLDEVLLRGVRADESAPGSGLGLAIVRDLAELHGGSIALESAPTGGLRARLRLPAA